MQRLLTLIITALLTFTSAYAYSDKDYLLSTTSKSKLAHQLLPRDKWIPYPQYSNRAAWADLFGPYASQYIKRGEKKLDYEWKVVPAMSYIEYQRSGNRAIMQSPIDANVNALTALVMAELAEGKGRFIPQIINGAFAFCEMTSWSLSAHLAAAQHSHSPVPEIDDQIIALLSSDIGSLMSWIHYFFHDAMDQYNPQISKRIAYELDRRIMTPYMSTDRFWWMAFKQKKGRTVNNWNPWCNANVLQTFLLMEPDHNRLVNAVYRTMTSVDQFINYTHLDGGCEEGPSYWGHAAGKLYDYLSILSMATGGQVSIFDKPMIRHMGEYICNSYIGDGWVVNFADASARFDAKPSMIFRFGKAVNSPVMMGFAHYLISQQDSIELPRGGHDLYRSMATVYYQKALLNYKGEYNPLPNVYYPQTGVCYMRRGKWFAAAKGGYNNESHNHNDAGSYILYYNEKPMIIDVGVGTYTRQTFSRDRYKIWTMRSLYHNLPVINGQEEPYGADYKADSLSFDPQEGLFRLELSHAYPSDCGLQSWFRSYHLTDSGFTLTDDYHFDEVTEPIVHHFMIAGQVTIEQPGRLIIDYKGSRIRLSYDPNRYTYGLDTIKIDDPRLTKVWGDTLYRLSLTDTSKSPVGTDTFTFTAVK